MQNYLKVVKYFNKIDISRNADHSRQNTRCDSLKEIDIKQNTLSIASIILLKMSLAVLSISCQRLMTLIVILKMQKAIYMKYIYMPGATVLLNKIQVQIMFEHM